jgi:hypothetical protein
MDEREKKAGFNRERLLPLVIFVLGLGFAVLVPPGLALASAIKVWTTGETLRSADLNAVLAHIHNNMVGAHGARLTNADVNASAAIAHSKLQTPALIPKAWAYVQPSCGASPCSIAASSAVNSITRVSQGLYDVTLSYTPANVNFAVLVTPTAGSAYLCRVSAIATSAPHFRLNCFDTVPAVQDTGFAVHVMDDI